MSEQLAGTVSAAGEPLRLAVPFNCALGAVPGYPIGNRIVAPAAPVAPLALFPSSPGIVTLAALEAPLMPSRTSFSVCLSVVASAFFSMLPMIDMAMARAMVAVWAAFSMPLRTMSEAPRVTVNLAASLSCLLNASMHGKPNRDQLMQRKITAPICD